MAKSRQIAAEVARLPIWAVRWTKRSINRMIRQQLELVLEPSIAFEALTMMTEDHAESANAILEKRPPVLKGY